MALQFPSDPALVNNIYDAPNGVTYYYDGTKWSGHGLPSNQDLQESTQDAVAELFSAGTQTGIIVNYDDTNNSLDLTVLDQSWNQLTDQPFIPSDLSDLTDNTPLIPQDITDLTDNSAIIPHDVSDLTDNTAIIPHDVSELTDNSAIIPPYYTLPVATNNDLGGITVGHNLIITSQGDLSTEPYLLDIESPTYSGTTTDLDLTNQVFALGTGTWRLPDGMDGQICYFTMQTTGDATTALVIIDNVRVIRNNIAQIQSSAIWAPFDNVANSAVDATSTVTAVFTDGAWNVSQGIIN